MATHAASRVLVIGDEPVSEDVARAIAGACGLPTDADGAPDTLDVVCERLVGKGIPARVVEQQACDVSPGDAQARVLLDAIGEGVCLGDSRGRVLWSNAFFRGLDPASRRLVSERLREAAQAFSDAAAAGGAEATGGNVVRSEFESPEGDRAYEVFITPAPPRPLGGDLGERPEGREAAERRASKDGVQRLAGVVRDTTRSRRAMAKLAAIDRAGAELVRLDSATLRALNSFQRLQLLEEKIVRLFHDVLAYDHFAIFLIDRKRNKLELVISAGLPPEIQDLELTPEAEGSGISGYVAATGQTYVCRDASTDDRFLPGLIGAKSSLTVPLRINDAVIGILDIESQQTNAFDAAAQQFVEIFAQHIALALHMLDLLVVERSSTNESTSDRLLSEIRDPLDDIAVQLAGLEQIERASGEDGPKIRRIRDDVGAIRARLASAADGPQTLIGVDRAMTGCDADPVLIGRRVLVADDLPKIRKVIAAVLRARGAIVEVCESGEAAINALEAVLRGELPPFDLVVSDIQMPDRNGYEVFAAARRVNPDARVILMTGFGYDPHHSIVRASQQGLQNVLFKPFDIEQLITEARVALAKPSVG